MTKVCRESISGFVAQAPLLSLLCEQYAKPREEGKKSNGFRYINASTAGFIATKVE